MKSSIFVTTSMAVAVALAGCSGTAKQTAEMEKCYGVAQAGKNDCAGAAHACAGQSSVSRATEDFVSVPAGTCEKLVGGVTG